MSGPIPRPTQFSLRSAHFGRGWAGVLLLAAGLGAASLAPPDPAALGQLSFQPARGPAGIRVVLEGDGLDGARAVRFGNQEAAFQVISAQRVEVHVPQGAASAPITLVGAGGGVFTTGAAFQVTPERPGPPAIARFLATGAPGEELSVSGSGFAAVEEARLAGRPAEFIVLSDSDLVVYVPPDQTVSGPLSVSSPFGTAISARPFVVKAEGPYQ